LPVIVISGNTALIISCTCGASGETLGGRVNIWAVLRAILVNVKACLPVGGISNNAILVSLDSLVT
jgi:hypothetical protein